MKEKIERAIQTILVIVFIALVIWASVEKSKEPSDEWEPRITTGDF